jgi:ABC-type amino acid transport substrate-binding protein
VRWLVRLLVAVALWVGAFTAGHADQLDTIRAAGVLRVAVSDGNPPFSFVDPLSGTIIGYNIDFARAIAAGIGVELQLVVATLADRVALLQSGKVDLIVAEMTINGGLHDQPVARVIRMVDDLMSPSSNRHRTGSAVRPMTPLVRDVLSQTPSVDDKNLSKTTRL